MPLFGNTPLERALTLAAVSGLKLTFGPALLAAARNRPERNTLAMAAMGEMVIDKLPLTPSRNNFALLVPRALAGYWVTKECLAEYGVEDPSAAALGAVVAAGVASVAPLVRGALGVVLPDPLLGVAEDYLALRFGGEAVGLSMQDIQQAGMDVFGPLQERAQPLLDQAREAVGSLQDQAREAVSSLQGQGPGQAPAQGQGI